jgi:hypothetical protein
MLLFEYADSNLVSIMCVINKHMCSESIFKHVGDNIFMVDGDCRDTH